MILLFPSPTCPETTPLSFPPISVPRSILKNRFVDLVSYGVMPRGGHFAAMEAPELLATNFFGFVKKVEERRAGQGEGGDAKKEL